MLHVIVDSLDDVPEGAREHYAERDGKFELDLTGAFSTLDRDALMGSLRKERDVSGGHVATIKTFGKWTPETIRKLETDHDDATIELIALKKDGGPTGEDIDKIVETRVLARLAPVQRDLGRATEKVESLTGEVSGLVKDRTKGKILRDVVTAFGLKELGANPAAVVDVELWATSAFEVDESGAVVSVEGPGVVPGLKPVEVFKDMKDNKQRGHWFGPTVGAGASGGSDKNDTGDSPFKLEKETGKLASLTEASKIVKDDPERARRLAKAAGSKKYFPSLFK